MHLLQSALEASSVGLLSHGKSIEPVRDLQNRMNTAIDLEKNTNIFTSSKPSARAVFAYSKSQALERPQ
jgi:hypothetical protein